jgi:hypothetical protein
MSLEPPEAHVLPPASGLLPAARNVLWRHAARARALVVLFPGMAYGADAPLLRFSRLAALEMGCDVLEVEYAFQAARAPYRAESEDSVVGEVCDTLGRASAAGYGRRMFVSKSLGTRLAPAVAKAAGLRVDDQVFLTPIPSSVPVIEGSGALVVTGSADPLLAPVWRARLAADAGLRLRIIDRADHALEVPGDVRASLAALHAVTLDVLGALEAFAGSADGGGRHRR